jgi:hypothetical protein
MIVAKVFTQTTLRRNISISVLDEGWNGFRREKRQGEENEWIGVLERGEKKERERDKRWTGISLIEDRPTSTIVFV